MTPTELEQAINGLEKDVDRLHALYNQYFMGIEKLEPSVPRKNLDRKINILRREHIKNTALRFRLQMQIQKYNTQCTYWNRICREIENGTYRRQIMLAKRRTDARHAVSKHPPHATSTTDADNTGAFEVDLDDLGLGLDEPFGEIGNIRDDSSRGEMNALDDPFSDATISSPPPPVSHDKRKPTSPSRPKPPRPPVVKQPSPAVQKPGTTEEEKMKTIYRRYLAARKKCNEPIAGITYDLVQRSLKDKIRSSQSEIDFKVVIRGGKAAIKSVKKVPPSDE